MSKTTATLGVDLILGLCVLVRLISSAEAVIKIETAQVQNGVAFIQGNSAALGAQITWEGGAVTTANAKNGGFSFFGVLPADCQGTLSDVPVNVLGCTPVAPAPVEVTGQTVMFATGDDGAIQAGVPFPQPRFTDNGNGTVTDNLTHLIWLSLPSVTEVLSRCGSRQGLSRVVRFVTSQSAVTRAREMASASGADVVRHRRSPQESQISLGPRLARSVAAG